MHIESKFRELHSNGSLDLPFPASGQTPRRHRKLAEIARKDLALARLAEAHVDAIAILHEAGRQPQPGLYGVWAAETSGHPIVLTESNAGFSLSGTKMFCSGAGIVDRALVTVSPAEPLLIDVDLRAYPGTITFDQTAWNIPAFAETQTATTKFVRTPVSNDELIGSPGWYLKRPGFWHGACGPASCWAGGAMGLVDYALAQSRDDAQTMAHLGAMKAAEWALWAYLERAGQEIDQEPKNPTAATQRALMMRHLVEQAATDILKRLGRAYGPRALAFDKFVSLRYQELEIYIRQCHAERDLEALGRNVFHSADHCRTTETKSVTNHPTGQE
jgi:hypothetical protein